MDEKEVSELREKSKKYADSVGIMLNPDTNIVDNIISGLLRNKDSKGDLYCPCRLVSGDKEIVCPCVYHRGEIELQGFCHCRLFVKKE